MYQDNEGGSIWKMEEWGPGKTGEGSIRTTEERSIGTTEEGSTGTTGEGFQYLYYIVNIFFSGCPRVKTSTIMMTSK